VDRKPVTHIRWRDVKPLLGESFDAWQRHNAVRLGAALAYYALLSLAPLLLVLIAIVGLVFGHSTAQEATAEQIRALIGHTAGDALKALIEGSRNTTHGVVATICGIGVLLFSASGVVTELRDSLNTIWEVPQQDLRGMRMVTGFIRRRLFSFAVVLGVGLLLIASVAVSTWINALGSLIPSFPGIETTLLEIASSILSIVVIAALFAAVYKIMPDAQIEWRDVLLGSLVTSLLFTVGKQVLSVYLGRASYRSTYGAAGSVIVSIAWVYYSSQIFFLGAEFTRAFASRYGSRLSTKPGDMAPAASLAQTSGSRSPAAAEAERSVAKKAGST
jgi:membrane protein